MEQVIRIIGIDPGYAIVGFGVIEYTGNKFRVIDYGAITTDAGVPFEKRLGIIWNDLKIIIDNYKPDEMAVEQLFFAANAKTAIHVAHARGVILLSAVENGIKTAEYTPLQIKQSVVGYGMADKNQVQQMTKMLLGLPEIPKPDDTADALAVAICHAHSASSYLLNH